MTPEVPSRQAIRYGNQRIEFQWIADPERAGRIRISVDPMVGVQVTAPASATAADVRAAVRRRARWISRRLVHSRDEQVRSRFVSGEPVLYLGRRYVLKVQVAQVASVKLKGGLVLVRLPNRTPALVARALNDWYRMHAERYFRRRLAELFSPALDGGNQHPSFRLQAMSRQWGSCSPAGNLVLNPALVRAPRDCVDYVIVHELCHRKHHDHGAAFKKLLGLRMPDWQVRKDALEAAAFDILR